MTNTTADYRKINAAQISSTLRKAGFPKASRYKTFGRDQDGFEVMISKGVEVRRYTYPYAGREKVGHRTYEWVKRVTVVYTGGRHNTGQDKAQAYCEALRAAGWDARIAGLDKNQVEILGPQECPANATLVTR